MQEIITIIRESSNGAFDGVSDSIIIAMAVVGIALLIMSIIALVVSIILGICYMKYNRTNNSANQTGEVIAREVLDKNELQHIKVSKNGSILFGNSYSHFFKKVRLRRLTWQKTSVSSMAMAVQKSCLAILDKENDPDMKARIRMTPIIYFGPLAYIPLVIIGAIIDYFVFNGESANFTIIFTCAGTLIYVVSFIMSIKVMKTEKKAQERALSVMKEDGIATDEEVTMCKKLFKLYNIEYINNMIIALLELVYRVLQIIAYIQNSSSKSSS